MTSVLCELPALRLAELIRRREISSREVVDAHIARIEAVNPALVALVQDRFADARREADAADALARHAQELPPLHGVPCTIKEFISVRGMSWTAGLYARRDARAERDALVVERLRAAGAIVLGVTNVPEGGMWMETYNPIYGRTSNPWDVTRTSGGSSGGEAALIAAGASPFGIGSDIAGSIRIPAAMCGVIGHKPTARLVSNDGQWPDDGNTDDMLCTGPMGRTVRDVERVLELIVDRPLPPPPKDLQGLRVIPVAATGTVDIAPVMRTAIERSAQALAARGATIIELDDVAWRRLFGRSRAAWMRGLAELGNDNSFESLISEGAGVAIGAEAMRILRGRGRFAVATLGFALIERLNKPFGAKILAGAPAVAETRAAFEELLGDRGVLLHPPYSRPAPRHKRPLLTPFDAVCTALFSVTGFPGTSVPVGFDENHMPVGVQVLARRGNDRLTLAVARALEESLGGWVPAPTSSSRTTASG